MKYSFPFVCLLSLLAACNQNPSKTAPAGDWSDSAVSTIKYKAFPDGKRLLEKDNTFYDVVSFLDKSDAASFLLKITKHEKHFIDSVNGENHFTVAAQSLNNSSLKWKADFDAADIDYSAKVIVAHTEPSGDQEDTYTLYSLLNGNKLMSYTYGDLRALIPNTSHKRFFGYLSQKSAQDHPQNFADVTYCGSDKVIQTIHIRSKNKDIPVYTPELLLKAAEESGNTIAAEGKNVILAHASRQFSADQITGFALQINYFLPNVTEPITILLPVRNDHVDLSAAQYNKSIFELSE
ncbi:MAG: hypothetical protein U0T73_09175 [Chitinophagales bacterium]